VKEGDSFKILTDILGDEDYLGDMDFKVAGTQAGVTALQMDIKIEGITKEIMEQALAQAKDGRLHILEHMITVLAQPRESMSEHAPVITRLKIDKEKIGDVIGKGGSTIRSIIEKTGVNMEIDDDGTVNISSSDEASSKAAIEMVEALTKDVEVGEIYEGKVARIVDFGAFVNLLPGKDGLVHISQIAEERVEKVEDYLQEGQIVKVKVVEIDRQGRIRLTMKEV